MFKKHIKLTAGNLAETIDAIRGRATTWTHDVYDIRRAAVEAEQKLETLGLAKKDRVGAFAMVVSGGPSSKAYKYAATGSITDLQRYADGWRVMSYVKYDLYPGTDESVTVTLPEAVKQRLADAYFKRLGVVFVKPRLELVAA